MNQTLSHQSSFNLHQAYKKAWSLVEGSKHPIWLIYLCYFLAVALTLMLVSWIFGNGLDPSVNAGPNADAQRALVYSEMILKVVLAPLSVGAFMVAILRVRGQQVSSTAGFHYFPQWLNLSLTQLLIVIAQLFVRESTDLLRTVGEDNTLVLILYFLGVFFINFFTIFALPLVADKQLKPWQAIKTSAVIVARNWIKVLTLLLSVIIIWVLLFLPLAINLLWVVFMLVAAVWLLPFSLLLLAMLYQHLFDGKVAEVNSPL